MIWYCEPCKNVSLILNSDYLGEENEMLKVIEELCLDISTTKTKAEMQDF